MKVKLYKVTEEVQFSINADETVNYNRHLEDESFNYIEFHVILMLHHNEHDRFMSIYIPMSNLIKKEYNKMNNNYYVGHYKPSKEFIQIVRVAAIMLAKDLRYSALVIDPKIINIICENVQSSKK